VWSLLREHGLHEAFPRELGLDIDPKTAEKRFRKMALRQGGVVKLPHPVQV